MKTIFTAAAAALLVTTASAAIAPSAHAQAAPGVGVLDIEAAVENSQAYQAAVQQIQATYAAQIQQANERNTAFQQEIAPQVEAFRQAQQNPNADRNALAQQYQQLQQRRQQAEQEIQQILAPVALAKAYVEDQIASQLGGALDRVMARRQIAIVLRPEATLKFVPTLDLTADVVTELNAVVPSVSTNPPAGWQPGQQGQQQQQPAPTQSQPQGR
ncbi:OmpH family outer membrane protein [Sphingosinithalassobacter portus]|uniref:OmpH family outer membrane protein n=1 Tax=Stakelama portus TaxID=2676234 RepID=UPI000D6E8731|nr:OmpH family outer membrane protein [Sphingosinithalassobacter portus]